MALATKSPKGVSEKLGAQIKLDYLQRLMKAYPVTENEIEMLDHYSEHKTFFFAFATFFLGLACEIKLHASFAHGTTLSAEANVLAVWGFWILFVLAIGFGLAALRAAWRGKNIWKVIRGESQATDRQAPNA